MTRSTRTRPAKFASTRTSTATTGACIELSDCIADGLVTVMQLLKNKAAHVLLQHR
jgi:hypothetical protein